MQSICEPLSLLPLKNNTTVRYSNPLSFRVDQKGIDIHLEDLRMVHCHVGEAHDRFFNRPDIRPGLSSESCEELMPLDLLDHPYGAVSSDRRKSELHVLKDFDEYTSYSEHQKRPKNRIAVHAENYFFTAWGHLLNQDGIDHRR